jgi:RNA binding exosome subunit
MNVKTSNYYGTYMRVLQELQKTTSGYYGNYMRVLQRMLKKPSEYHGTHMKEECQQLFVAHMRVLQGMQNANSYYGTCMRVLQ